MRNRTLDRKWNFLFEFDIPVRCPEIIRRLSIRHEARYLLPEFFIVLVELAPIPHPQKRTSEESVEGSILGDLVIHARGYLKYRSFNAISRPNILFREEDRIVEKFIRVVGSRLNPLRHTLLDERR